MLIEEIVLGGQRAGHEIARQFIGPQRVESGRVRRLIGLPWRSVMTGEASGFSNRPGGNGTQKGAANHSASDATALIRTRRANCLETGGRNFKHGKPATIHAGGNP